MSMRKRTLVIGASEDPSRYANLAIRKLLSYGHEVLAIGSQTGKVEQVSIITEHAPFTDVDTITLYLRPQIQQQYYDYILALQPKRVIFNPGTENQELVNHLLQHKIEPVEACTLVMLSTGQY
jgi:predicted CoA-binding protein